MGRALGDWRELNPRRMRSYTSHAWVHLEAVSAHHATWIDPRAIWCLHLLGIVPLTPLYKDGGLPPASCIMSGTLGRDLV